VIDINVLVAAKLSQAKLTAVAFLPTPIEHAASLVQNFKV